MGNNNKNKTLKFQLLTYLGQGILPFEQWSGVFSNPDLSSMPGLICKGYTVWFPTTIDYINRPKDIDEAFNHLKGDNAADYAISMCIELEEYYKKIIALYSREEQLFMNDRRLQNVHGLLSMFRSKSIKTRYYDSAKDTIVVEHLDRSEYREIMKMFYPTMQASTLNLRDRLVTTEFFKEFVEFYLEKLKIDPHLMRIAKSLGVLEDSA